MNLSSSSSITCLLSATRVLVRRGPRPPHLLAHLALAQAAHLGAMAYSVMKGWMKISDRDGHVTEMQGQVGQLKGKGKGQGKLDPASISASNDSLRDIDITLRPGRIDLTLLQAGELAGASLLLPHNGASFIEVGMEVDTPEVAPAHAAIAVPAPVPVALLQGCAPPPQPFDGALIAAAAAMAAAKAAVAAAAEAVAGAAAAAGPQGKLLFQLRLRT